MENIVGQTITAVRPLTQDEMDVEGWDSHWGSPATAIELENGAVLYASRDEEGNGAGVLFGQEPDGTCISLTAVEVST